MPDFAAKRRSGLDDSSFDVQSWLLKRAMDEYQLFVQRLAMRERRVNSKFCQDAEGAAARLC